MQIRPAAVTADPSSGTIPTGYLIWNVADGAVKRHSGAYSWEITVGANASAKVGFHGVTPTAKRAGVAQAAVTCASQTVNDQPTRAAVQAINDGLVATVMRLHQVLGHRGRAGVIKCGA